jgi:hypothetical protein
MRRSPLVAAILSGSFAFQLLLAGGGTTCVDPAHGSLAGDSDPGLPAMAGMDMSMSMPDHGPDADYTPLTDPTPCDQPTAPSDCQVLAACATSIVVSAIVDLEMRDVTITERITRPTLALSSRAIPPEPPPPRA